MIVGTQLVFDDFISGTTSYYTSSAFNSLLGSGNKTSFEYRITPISGTATVSVDYEHSDSGQDWPTKKTGILSVATSANTVSVGMFADTDTAPLGAMARLRISGSASTIAHVKIIATVRND